MSKYEWERGTLVIPRNQWSSFTTVLIGAYNKYQTALFSTALAIHARILVITKSKRGWKEKGFHALVQSDPLLQSLLAKYELEAKWQIECSMFKTRADGRAMFSMPKKSDFPMLTRSKLSEMIDTDARLSFDRQSCSVTWDVQDNNHAVERARSGWLGQLLFGLLRTIKWGRNSGGVIVGNNEYHRDNTHAGGGANYISAWFGPLGLREAQLNGAYITNEQRGRGYRV